MPLVAAALLLGVGGDVRAQGVAVATGRLVEPRRNHTATLLPNGKVLVVGGSGVDGTFDPIASAELYDSFTGTWRSTGSVALARQRHTATLLPNGKVLVVGGSSANLIGVSSAELYDPATEVWTPTGSLNTSRNYHTATLLQNGKVLIAGGERFFQSGLDSAELYDPSTGTWTPTGSLGNARLGHTATLLQNGQVLVAGGGDRNSSSSGAVASAELYDPATGRWTKTGSPAKARDAHTATVLGNGKVLLVAGVANGTTDGSAELYDPVTGVWSATGSLAVARNSHTATLLPSGQVLVNGGVTTAGELYDPTTGRWTATSPFSTPRAICTATLLPSGDVLVVGGFGGSVLASAEVFQPGGGAWTVTGSLAAVRTYHTATLLPNGKVLVAGGLDSGGIPVASAELYDPAIGTWTTTGSMAQARYEHTATLLPNGKVLVAGGRTGVANNLHSIASAELYDPGTGTWTATSALLKERERHTATLLPNGKVLVAGGAGGGFVTVPIVVTELYDPATGSWTAGASLTRFWSGHTAMLLRTGDVLLVGGGESSAELYNARTGTWTATGSLAASRFWHAAALLPSGKVLVVGGFLSGLSLSSAEVYDPTTGTWTTIASMANGRSNGTATVLPNGKVLVAGGASIPSAELYDPATGTWTPMATVFNRLGHTATVLTNGQLLVAGGTSTAELYDTRVALPKPSLTTVPSSLRYDVPTSVVGTNLGGVSEGGDGRSSSSAANYPLFQVRSIANDHVSWLPADPRSNFSDEPMTVVFSRLPATLDPGWNYVTPVRAGISGPSRLVNMTCGLVISGPPQHATVAIGERTTFAVDALGGRHFQWEKNAATSWIPVGDDSPRYTTEGVTANDAGTRYRVTVTGACSNATTPDAVLTVADATAPSAAVVSPSGGEYWLLSAPGSPPTAKVVTWSMADNVRVCRVAVSLLYSNDGGSTYMPAPDGGGLPATFGTDGSCPFPGEATTSTLYTVPAAFPSGRAGSLYKVHVAVTDQAGNVRTATSANPFYVVQPNPDSVKTIILWNASRMVSRQGISAEQAAVLGGKLQELGNHPRVQGVVVNLSDVTTLQSLYAAWDADPSNTRKANSVLFGPGGIHGYLRTNLLATYSGVNYLVLVGDDRIIPMARMHDRTVLLLESSYPAGGDLSPTQTTVGQALAAGKYLTDDPLAVLDAVTASRLEDSLYLPDLSIGRLVETPQEIITTIATYISQDGILDLSLLHPASGHKVLVTGYDFLSSAAMEIRARWKRAFGVATPNTSTAPVDGSLIGGNWGLGSVEARASALRTKAAGNAGPHYSVIGLAGHATHYEEGVPGTDPFDIQGLSTADLYGADACGTPTAGSIDLFGAVVYAVGCHGGLNVPGSCRTDLDRSLDLPQTMLGRGVVVYIANSGYGWGLRFGIGYSARLVQIFTEQVTSHGSIGVGDVVRRTKQQYYVESPRYDPYDEKTVMQWTLYGLPMYVVRTGITPTTSQQTAANATEAALGRVRVRRGAVHSSDRATLLALPSSLTQLTLSFDLTAEGVFDKHDSSGRLITGSGCPDANGCYYTLNGLVDRGTGSTDLPIQPYLIYDSRLSGSSQHGALWKGGTYDEETGWKPVIAELLSNGGDGADHGPAPRHIRLRPTTPRVVPGVDAPDCRPTDLELNTLVVTAGEAVKNQESDPTYSISRVYRTTDVEIFYFNNRTNPAENCERAGPALGSGPFGGMYHHVDGARVSWTIPASDPEGVWRVVVVYTRNTVDAEGRGAWVPLELTNDGSGTFRGEVLVTGTTRLTYVVQAVDNRGNVTWLDYVSSQLPASGVQLGVPNPVDVSIGGSGGRRRTVRH